MLGRNNIALLPLGYIIEKKQSTSTKWSRVVTLDSHCLQYTLDNLREQSEYTFSVIAENAVGVSPAALTGNVILNANASKSIYLERGF